MQVLKEATRKSVEASAINAFMEKGYSRASMREIAAGANMSVGNLYRYFENKEALFGHLVTPVIDKFRKIPAADRIDLDCVLLDINLLEDARFINMIIESRALYREGLFILFLRAEGSPYEGTKKLCTEHFENIINVFMATNFDEDRFTTGRLFAKSMASTLVNTFCVILEESKDDEEFVFSIFEFMEYMVKPSLRNLIGIKNGDIKFRRITNEEISRRFSCCRSNRGDSSTQSH